jgi:D-alanine-D-alanine ligase
MNQPEKVVIIHNDVSDESPADARDILDQIRCVSDALRTEGYRTSTLTIGLDLAAARVRLRTEQPAVVFNLVEAIDDSGQLVPVATALLDHLRIPYTGAGTEALMITSNKILTKQWLRLHDIATPDWWDPETPAPAAPAAGRWITKPLYEDASIGMDDASVVADFGQVAGRIAEKKRQRPCRWFAEQFVEGREVNVALLGGPEGPQVLPIPEIEFIGFPENKPRIVGYAAKWAEDSFECRHTVRRFVDQRRESSLCRQLGVIALRCWDIFQLRGYARVDFRVDASGQPWVLEINANPCISPDAGFAAALAEQGIPYSTAIRQVIAEAQKAAGS